MKTISMANTRSTLPKRLSSSGTSLTRRSSRAPRPATTSPISADIGSAFDARGAGEAAEVTYRSILLSARSPADLPAIRNAVEGAGLAVDEEGIVMGSQTDGKGIGQTTCIGIGGDPIIGTNFIKALSLFKDDPATEGVLMIGEIGGSAEEEAAEYIQANISKPMSAYIAGVTAPAGKKMGHAGAIVSGGKGTAQGKMDALSAEDAEALIHYYGSIQ